MFGETGGWKLGVVSLLLWGFWLDNAPLVVHRFSFPVYMFAFIVKWTWSHDLSLFFLC